MIKNVQVGQDLHLKKSGKFYALGKKYWEKARKTEDLEAIVMDYQRNLQIPNSTTNDVYYRRSYYENPTVVRSRIMAIIEISSNCSYERCCI